MQPMPPTLDEVVNEIAELRPLGSIATRILDLTEGDRFSAHQLATAISSDQALTAKMLRLSNSPYYGFPRRITTVRDAVVLLGFRAVRSATLALCVIDAVAGATHIDPRTFWQFSVTVGMLAEVLGRTERRYQDEAFTAGVLHNIGRLALDQHRPDLMRRVLLVADEERVSVPQAQIEVLGWTDAELGGGLALHWNFPTLLAEAVARHRERQEGPEGAQGLATLVTRARAFAASYGLDDSVELVGGGQPPSEWSQPPLSVALRRAGGMDGVMDRVGAFMEHVVPG